MLRSSAYAGAELYRDLNTWIEKRKKNKHGPPECKLETKRFKKT